MSAPSQDAFLPALIVIDMQNDFATGSLAVAGGPTIVPNVNSLIDLSGFKTKIASKDLHPPDHVSFAATHGAEVFSKITIHHPDDTEKKDGIEQVLWPVHCVRDTEGADFVPGLNTSSFETVIKKGVLPGIESYSAFQDVWGRNPTELPGILKEKGVTDVYFVGIATDYCVKWSAVDALKAGFKAWVVTDGVKSIQPEKEALDDLRTLGIKLTTTEEVKRVLSGSASA